MVETAHQQADGGTFMVGVIVPGILLGVGIHYAISSVKNSIDPHRKNLCVT